MKDRLRLAAGHGRWGLRLPAACLAAATALLVAAPARADPLPTITSVTVDSDNHAVVKWTKAGWQGSNNVKWSTDPTLDQSTDPGYGQPLKACQQGIEPGTDSNYVYGGGRCKGDDVANKATEHVTRAVMQAGTFYFQVTVAGENHQSGNPCRHDGYYGGPVGECLTGHSSNVWKVTFTAPKGGKTPGGGEQPGGGGQTPGGGQAPGGGETPGDGGDDGEAAIDSVRGKGTIMHPDGTQERAAGGVRLARGDKILTAGSPLELTTEEATIVLDRRSSLEQGGDGSSEVKQTVLRGRAYYSITAGHWFVKTPLTGAAAFCNGFQAECRFTVERRAGSIRFRVYAGLPVIGNDRDDLVRRGFERTFRAGKAPTKPRKFRPLKGRPFWKL